MNNDGMMLHIKEESELQNVVTNDEAGGECNAQHLDFSKKILKSSSGATYTVIADELYQNVYDTKDDDIVKEECEILTVKTEKDEVLSLKEENVDNEETGSIEWKTVFISEGGDIKEETLSFVHNTDENNLFDGYHESQLFTTENDSFEKKYLNSNYSCNSHSHAVLSSDTPANTYINGHEVPSVKKKCASNEEEITNYSSTSSPHNGNNAVETDKISQKVNDTDEGNIKEQKKGKPYCCSTCNYSTTIKRNLVRHMKIHSREKPLCCSVCDYTSVHRASMERHKQTHTDEKPYRCNTCDYSTITKRYLIEHIRIHTGEKPFHCTICDYSSAQEGNMARHKRTHNNKKPYRCGTCNYSASFKAYLVEHMRIHTGEKPFRCNLCDYSTAQRRNIATHKQIHDREKPYRCTNCDYSASLKRYLTEHMKIHTGEKPFSCSICDYKAAHSSNIAKHIRIHTGEKPFSCNYCDYRTIRKERLIIHMRTHTNEKPFHCNICEFRTIAKKDLVRHVRKHHS